jgi:hypothetical protein
MKRLGEIRARALKIHTMIRDDAPAYKDERLAGIADALAAIDAALVADNPDELDDLEQQVFRDRSMLQESEAPKDKPLLSFLNPEGDK